MPLAASVRAIGRAGAGTNNIPVAEMSKRGVPVFNAPGANANAVKELVLAALLLAARNVVPALHFVSGLDARGERPRSTGRGREEGLRRHRAAATYARDHRPRGHRQSRRRYRVQARHEGRRLRSGDHRRCGLAPAVERAQGAKHRRAPEACRFRHAPRAAASRDAAHDRCGAARRDETRLGAAQLRARCARRRRGHSRVAARGSPQVLPLRFSDGRADGRAAASWRSRISARRPRRRRPTRR